MPTIVASWVFAFCANSKLTTWPSVRSHIIIRVREVAAVVLVKFKMAMLFELSSTTSRASILQTAVSAVWAAVFAFHGIWVADVVVGKVFTLRQAHIQPLRRSRLTQ